MSISELCLPMLIGASRGKRVYRAREWREKAGGSCKESNLIRSNGERKRSDAAYMGVTLSTWCTKIVSLACMRDLERRAREGNIPGFRVFFGTLNDIKFGKRT